MTLSQQQFLELLRSGLWGHNADAELFKSSVDWKEILEIARQQTVLVIVADGIETLPKELWPSKEMITKLTMVRVKTLQMHNRMNMTINQIVSALNTEGIPSVLLKGQGVAQNYRKPESRSCGDIDLYVGEDNYERACEVVRRICNISEIHECGNQMQFNISNIEVEIHKRITNHVSQTEAEELEKVIALSLSHIEKTYWNNSGASIRILDKTTNAFYIFYHIINHFTSEGIGLRQVCDFILMLQKSEYEINWPKVHLHLKSFKLLEIWQVVLDMGHIYLGLSLATHHCNISLKNHTKAYFLLKHIFLTGNFGKYSKHIRNYNNLSYINRRWSNFIFKIKYLSNIIRISPSYIFSHTYKWLSNAIKRLIIDLINVHPNTN